MSINSHPFATTNIARHSSKWGDGLKNKLEHDIILTLYEAVHPTAISDKIFLIRDAYTFDKCQNSMYFTKHFCWQFKIDLWYLKDQITSFQYWKHLKQSAAMVLKYFINCKYKSKTSVSTKCIIQQTFTLLYEEWSYIGYICIYLHLPVFTLLNVLEAWVC